MTVDLTGPLAHATSAMLITSTGHEVVAHVLTVDSPRAVIQSDQRVAPPALGPATLQFGLPGDATYAATVTVEQVVGGRITLLLAAEPERNQQRVAPRYPLQMLARLARRNQRDFWITAHVRDLSTSGVGVLVAELLDRDEVVLFDAAFNSELFQCEARVVRREMDPKLDPFIRYGLAFENTSPADDAALQAFLRYR